MEDLLRRQAGAESGNRHTDSSGQLIESSAGALGVSQFMPATARDPGFGVTPLRDQSEGEYRRIQRDYMSALLNRYGGDQEKALAAYNWGPGNVDKISEDIHWRERLPTETKDYLSRITGDYEPAAPTAAPQQNSLRDMVMGATMQPATPEADTEWADLPKAMAVSIGGDVAKAGVALAENLTGQVAGKGETPLEQGATDLQKFLMPARKNIRAWQDSVIGSMTPEALDRAGREILTLDPQKTIWQGGPREFLSSLGLKASFSVGPTIGPMVGAAIANRIGLGASMSSLFGASEGLMSAGLTAAQIAEDIDSTPTSDLMQVAAFKKLADTYGEDEARRRFINDTQKMIPAITGLMTGAIAKAVGVPLDRIFGGAGGTLLQRVRIGAGVEAAQEVPQSFQEQVMQNYAQQAYDSNVNLLDGAFEQAVQGGLLGGLMGGTFAGAFGARPKQAISHDPVPSDMQAAIGAIPTTAAAPAAGPPPPPAGPGPGAPPAAPWTPPEAPTPFTPGPNVPPPAGEYAIPPEPGSLFTGTPVQPWEPNAPPAAEPVPVLPEYAPDDPRAIREYGGVQPSGRWEFDREDKLPGLGRVIDQPFAALPSPRREKPGLSLAEGPIEPAVASAVPAPEAPPGMETVMTPREVNQTREPKFGQQTRTELQGYRVRRRNRNGDIVSSTLVQSSEGARRLQSHLVNQINAEKSDDFVEAYPARRTFLNDRAPTAEPVGDILAQTEDLKTSDRKAVYLTRETIENLKGAGRLDEVLRAGVPINNFDTYGGVLVAKDEQIARELVGMLEHEAGNIDEILGYATGAGVSKPYGSNTAVQKLDEHGNVIRERLVKPEETQATLKEFGPGSIVTTLKEAMARRARRVARDRLDRKMRAETAQFAKTEPTAVEEAFNLTGQTAPSAEDARALAEQGGYPADIGGRLIDYATDVRQEELQRRKVDKRLPAPRDVTFRGRDVVEKLKEAEAKEREAKELASKYPAKRPLRNPERALYVKQVAALDEAIAGLEKEVKTLRRSVWSGSKVREDIAESYKQLYSDLTTAALRVAEIKVKGDEATIAELDSAEGEYDRLLKQAQDLLAVEGAFTRSEALVEAATRYSPAAKHETRRALARARDKATEAKIVREDEAARGSGKPFPDVPSINKVRMAEAVSLPATAKKLRRLRRYKRSERTDAMANTLLRYIAPVDFRGGKLVTVQAVHKDGVTTYVAAPLTEQTPAAANAIVQINQLLRQWLSDYRAAVLKQTRLDKEGNKADRNWALSAHSALLSEALGNIRSTHEPVLQSWAASAYVADRITDLVVHGKRWGVAKEMNIDGFWAAVEAGPEQFRDYLSSAITVRKDAPFPVIMTREDLTALSDADVNSLYVTSLAFQADMLTDPVVQTRRLPRSGKVTAILRAMGRQEAQRFGGRSKSAAMTRATESLSDISDEEDARTGDYRRASKTYDTSVLTASSRPRDMTTEAAKKHEADRLHAVNRLEQSVAEMDWFMENFISNPAWQPEVPDSDYVYGRAFARWMQDYAKALLEASKRGQLYSREGISQMALVSDDIDGVVALNPENFATHMSKLFKAESREQLLRATALDPLKLQSLRNPKIRRQLTRSQHNTILKDILQARRMDLLWSRNPDYRKVIRPVLHKIADAMTRPGRPSGELEWPSYAPSAKKVEQVTAILNKWRERERLHIHEGLEEYFKRYPGRRGNAAQVQTREFVEPITEILTNAGFWDRDIALEKQFKQKFGKEGVEDVGVSVERSWTKQNAEGVEDEWRGEGPRWERGAMPATKATEQEIKAAIQLRQLIKAAEPPTAHEVLNAIRTTLGPNHFYTPAVELLLSKPYVRQLRILRSKKLASTAEFTSEQTDFLRSGEVTTPAAVRINEADLHDISHTELIHTVVHELFHGATMGELTEGNRDIADAWDALREATYDALKDAPDFASYAYGLTNLYEFVSESQTNEKLQAAMKRTPVSNTPMTLWSKLIRLVMRIFKAPPMYYNLFDVALSLRPLTVTGRPFTEEGFAKYKGDRRGGPPRGATGVPYFKDAALQKYGAPLVNNALMQNRFVDEAVKRARDVSSTAGIKGTGFLLSALSMRQIKDFYAGAFQTKAGPAIGPLGSYMDAFFARNSDSSQAMEKADVLSRQWSKLEETGKGAEALTLSKMMRDATMLAIHPDAAFTPGVENTPNGHLTEAQRGDWEELHTEWNQLSQQAKDLYNGVRNYYRETTDREVQLMVLNALRASSLWKGNFNLTENDIDLKGIAVGDWLEQKLDLNTKADKARIKALEDKYDAQVASGKLSKSEAKARRAEIRSASADLESTVEELKLIARMARIPQIHKGPYFPLMRFGDYAVTAQRIVESKVFSTRAERSAYMAQKSAEDPTLQFNWPKSEDGTYPLTVSEKEFRLAESHSAAVEARKELVEIYGDNAVSAVQLKQDMISSGPTIEGNRALQTLLGKLEGNAAAQNAIRQFYIKSLSDRSFRKREVKRKNIRGVDPTLQHRTFAAYSKSASYYTAQLRYGHLMADAKADMKEVVKRHRDETDISAVRMGQVVNEIEKRDAMMTDITDTSEVVRKTVEAGQFMLLTSPSYWLINASQPYMVTLPWLAGHTTAAKAASALARAQKMIISPLTTKAINSWGGLKALKSRVAAEEAFSVIADVEKSIVEKLGAEKAQPILDMLTELKRESIIDLSFVAELRDIAQGEGKNWWDKTMDATRIMAHLTEVNNRIMTAIAAYDIALQGNLSNKDAVDFAKRAVAETQFDYSSGNKPRLFSGNDAWWKPMVFQFMQYVQHMYVMFFRHAKMWWSGTEQQKRIGRRVVLGMLATHLAAGGLVGVSAQPIKWALGLAMLLFGAGDDEDRTFKNFASGEYYDRQIAAAVSGLMGTNIASEAVRAGLPRLAGMDLSARMAFLQMYMIDLNPKNAETLFGSLALSFGGPAFGLAGNAYEGTKLLLEGDTDKGVEKLLPKMGRDAIKALRYSQEGMVDYSGKTIMNADQLSPWDLFLQSMGFTPGTVSERYDRNREAKDRSTYLSQTKADIMAAYRKADSTGEIDSVMERWSEWNQKNPRDRITRSELLRSKQAMRKSERNIQLYGADLGRRSRELDEAGSAYNVE